MKKCMHETSMKNYVFSLQVSIRGTDLPLSVSVVDRALHNVNGCIISQRSLSKDNVWVLCTE